MASESSRCPSRSSRTVERQMPASAVTQYMAAASRSRARPTTRRPSMASTTRAGTIDGESEEAAQPDAGEDAEQAGDLDQPGRRAPS